MKHEAIGLENDIARWFKSYLCDRRQLVENSGSNSKRTTVTCGVPLGFILGHLLFLTYVNDMSAVTRNSLRLYADDSAILVANKSRSVIEKELMMICKLLAPGWLITTCHYTLVKQNPLSFVLNTS